MPTETVASTYINNRDATPRIPSDLRQGGRSFNKRAWLHVAVATAGSLYKMFDLPSNAVLESLKLTTSADMGTTTTFNAGLYRTTMDGGAVVSAACFGTAIVTNAGAVVKKELLYDATYAPYWTVLSANLRIWEVLNIYPGGDPQIDYDVCLLTVGAADGGADLLLECSYKLV